MRETMEAQRSVVIRSIRLAGGAFSGATTLTASGLLMMIGGVLWFSVRIHQGLQTFEINDEIEQFVVARMLRHGLHLYRDVFSHHGPAPYMLAHIYASLISEVDFSYIRLIQAALALASCLAVMYSPALKSNSGRVWAAATYILLITMFWNIECLNFLTHYKITGFLFVIIAAQCVAPPLLSIMPRPAGLLLAGSAGALACSCAYSSAPAVIALFAASLMYVRRFEPTRLKFSALSIGLGMAITLSVVCIWLYLYGDIRGFFVYHIYFNQAVYAKYTGFSLVDTFRNLWLYFSPALIVHTIAVFLFVYWLYRVAALTLELRNQPVSYRIALLALTAIGVILTNVRGYPNLGDSGFVVVNSALFAIISCGSLEQHLRNTSTRNCVGSLLLIILVICTAQRASTYATTYFGVSQSDITMNVGTFKMGDEPIYKFVRSIANNNRDLVALSDNAVIYLKTGLLPATGNLFNTPWQSEYNTNPVDGYNVDSCVDINMRRPAVIWFFNWRVPHMLGGHFTRSTTDEYKPCIIEAIAKEYKPLAFDSPWYIRDDIYGRLAPFTAPDTDRQLDYVPDDNFSLRNKRVMTRGEVLSIYTPIEIKLTAAHQKRRSPLKSIGILFTTHGKQSSGEAVFTLLGSGQRRFSLQFSLADVADNKYHYFPVSPDVYISGQVTALSGGGVGAWESNWDDSYTCAIYEYVDGTRRYTLGCPIT